VPVGLDSAAMLGDYCVMRRVTLAAFCATTLVAQIEPLAVNTVAGATNSQVSVRNKYTFPATAFVIARDLQRPQWWASGGTYIPQSAYMIGNELRSLLLRDSILDTPLSSGGLLELNTLWPPSSRGVGPWYLVAAIFEDGATVGDGGDISRMVLARRKAYWDVQRAITILAARSNLVDSFLSWQHDVIAGEQSSSPEIDIPRRVLAQLKQRRTQAEIMDTLYVWQNRLAESRPSIFVMR
jgi:hypothetical protein